MNTNEHELSLKRHGCWRADGSASSRLNSESNVGKRQGAAALQNAKGMILVPI